MKIVHLIYSLNTGGSETMLVDIVNEQVRQTNVNIVIINKSYSFDLITKIDKNVKIYFINRKENNKNPYSVVKLNLVLLYINAHIIHCHNHNIIPLLFYPFKRKAVLTIHSLGINTIYFSKYKKLFAISKIVKDDIYKRAGLHSNLIYNGIYTDKISKKTTIEVNPTIFKIIIVSRLNHEIKGQHLAIEALYILNKQNICDIQLDLLGDGVSEQFLKDLCKRYGLIEQVVFQGLKDRDFIYSHLKYYHLLIQPSISEGFGLTITEGLSAKVPVLVSNIDGPMEIIENGKYGFYFQSGDANDLAKQILKIKSIYTTEMMKEKVNSAYQHVNKYFDIRNTVKNYIENY